MLAWQGWRQHGRLNARPAACSLACSPAFRRRGAALRGRGAAAPHTVGCCFFFARSCMHSLAMPPVHIFAGCPIYTLHWF